MERRKVHNWLLAIAYIALTVAQLFGWAFTYDVIVLPVNEVVCQNVTDISYDYFDIIDIAKSFSALMFAFIGCVLVYTNNSWLWLRLTSQLYVFYYVADLIGNALIINEEMNVPMLYLGAILLYILIALLTPKKWKGYVISLFTFKAP